jgi:hypothetical protein
MAFNNQYAYSIFIRIKTVIENFSHSPNLQPNTRQNNLDNQIYEYDNELT